MRDTIGVMAPLLSPDTKPGDVLPYVHPLHLQLIKAARGRRLFFFSFGARWMHVAYIYYICCCFLLKGLRIDCRARRAVGFGPVSFGSIDTLTSPSEITRLCSMVRWSSQGSMRSTDRTRSVRRSRTVQWCQPRLVPEWGGWGELPCNPGWMVCTLVEQ